MKKSTLCFFLLFFSIGNCYSQHEDNLVKISRLLDSIARSIRSKENLSIEWETSFIYGKDRVNDTHSAKIKGLKYFHQTKNMIITCNGEFVCREYKDPKKVIVSNCDTTVDYNPIYVLTFFGKGYRVKRIKKHNNSGKIKSIRIETIDDKSNLIKEAFLYFEEDGTLSCITFKTTGKFRNYVKIQKLDSFIVLKDNEFEIPK